ncbi:DUF58 domain-containing protein [Lacisediminimonas profundi]|uniref:DUF58 domain-containing protein n=1 Tax=Lacisediminimonas profundi TaxID=2603856 RepID=UPI00124B28BF|nr:DUF58 domain-containing protein [Lacisediminimonas profundi]
MRPALALPQLFRHAIDTWLFQLKPAEHGEVVLHRRRVFILPTRAGMAFVVMLLGLFIGSVNYNLNMGFALTFLVTGCALVGMYLTYRNLAWLHLSPGRSTPVFAGGEALFELQLANRSRHARYAIDIGFIGDDATEVETMVDLPAFGECSVRLAAPARQRGWLQAPRIRLQTQFPLGLLRAWSYWQPELATLVYPKPEEDGPPLPPSEMGGKDGSGRAGHDDFAGVRAWQAGDSPSRLAWRQIARMGDGAGALVSKHFEGGSSAELCIAEDMLAGLPLEQRLSRMTRWVLEAEQRGLAWRFMLGGMVLPAAQGAAHRDECLRALALYHGGTP